jgi:nicotinate-nucleotide--dimethylbenzimidazole phosphoribosyltransferase
MERIPVLIDGYVATAAAAVLHAANPQRSIIA